MRQRETYQKITVSLPNTDDKAEVYIAGEIESEDQGSSGVTPQAVAAAIVDRCGQAGDYYVDLKQIDIARPPSQESPPPPLPLTVPFFFVRSDGRADINTYQMRLES